MKKMIEILRKVSVLKFIKYNFFCKQVKRDKGVYLIPYRNSILDLSPNSMIEIKGRHLHIGVNRLLGSKAETLVRLEGNALWYVNNGAGICYNTTIEIKNNAVLDTGYFFLNSGNVIVCSKSIRIGNDVWFGRDNTVYDNDHHQLLDDNNNICNPIEPINIGNRVWITNHISILKGVHIGDGVVISPYSVIRKNVAPGTLVGEKKDITVFKNEIKWSPDLII